MKKELQLTKNINVESVFCFHKVMYYADKCCNGVGYKRSTQYFKLHMFTIISNTCNNIKNNNYIVNKTYNFTINERGKIRHIEAPYINDRLIHKVLSNEVLNPIYNHHLIYDNGASIKNKGFKFTLDRVKNKLYNYYLKYGTEGYVVFIDFHKFFPTCSHETIKNIHNKYIKDKNLKKIIEDYLFISEGIALGVELAQKEASIVPNKLDHLIQNNYKFVRYMDDSIFFVRNYSDAKEILTKYYLLANELKININSNKSYIKKIGKSFIYCKWKFKINSNGKIVMIPVKKTIVRQKNKLKKMYKNNISYEFINEVKNSFIAYLSLGNSYFYKEVLRNINY